MKLVWMPQWYCQNYSTDGNSRSSNCPYCPYGYKSGFLTYENKPVSSNKMAKYEDVRDFFILNSDIFRHFIEISGGEALLYPHLHRLLGGRPDGLGSPWTWAMTSNTLETRMLEKIINSCGGRIDGCISWTASFHPFSNKDDLFKHNLELIRSSSNCNLKITVVLSKHTIGTIEDILKRTESMPTKQVHFHLETHDIIDDEFKAKLDNAKSILGHRLITAGNAQVNKLCHKNEKLMSISPDGSIYHCVSKSYQNIDPIGNVADKIKLADLPKIVELCPISCFAECDHSKWA